MLFLFKCDGIILNKILKFIQIKENNIIILKILNFIEKNDWLENSFFFFYLIAYTVVVYTYILYRMMIIPISQTDPAFYILHGCKYERHLGENICQGGIGNGNGDVMLIWYNCSRLLVKK